MERNQVILVGWVWMASTGLLLTLPSATGSNRRSLSLGGCRTHRHSHLCLSLSLAQMRSEPVAPVVHGMCPFTVQDVGGWQRRCQTICGPMHMMVWKSEFSRIVWSILHKDWMDGGWSQTCMHGCTLVSLLAHSGQYYVQCGVVCHCHCQHESELAIASRRSLSLPSLKNWMVREAVFWGLYVGHCITDGEGSSWETVLRCEWMFMGTYCIRRLRHPILLYSIGMEVWIDR